METERMKNYRQNQVSCIEMTFNPLITIEFKQSKSKQLQLAVNLMQRLPDYHYNEFDKVHSAGVKGIEEYAKYYLIIEELILIIIKWKSTIVKLGRKNISRIRDYFDFKDEVTLNAGPYKKILKSNMKVAINSVVFEDLPLPLVYYPSHYGAFFAFSDNINSEIYFCECQRRAIENYVRLREQTLLNNCNTNNCAPLGSDYFSEYISKISLLNKENPLSLFGFKENLCFKCNSKIPKLKYCHPMYGTSFKQKYGWYIKQKFFEFGFDKYQMTKNSILKDECPPRLYDEIIHYSRLIDQGNCQMVDNELEKERAIYKKGIEDEVENIARVELGFPKIGESWTSEVLMFNIVEGIYLNYETKRHYRPKWLEGLELDIFIPELSLAFEYQGIQHYEAVEHWGGLEQLKKQQKNDKRKKELCMIYGVDLIIVNYNDELSTDFLEKKISDTTDRL